MNNSSSDSMPQDNSFSCPMYLDKKEFDFSMNVDEKKNILKVILSEKSPRKLIKVAYKKEFKIEELTEINCFFKQFEKTPIAKVLATLKKAIEKKCFSLREDTKQMHIVFDFISGDVELTLPEEIKMEGEIIEDISKTLFDLKEHFSEKNQIIEEIADDFNKIKKGNRDIHNQNLKLSDTNEKIIKEKKLLEDTIKILKEADIETLLKNISKTEEEKLREKVLRDYKGKLEGDLLNENTIAFDELSKAFLWYWMNNSENNKVSTTLLYKGTRDGDRSSTFHSKCDNKGPTLTLVKTTTDFHFGGFTRANWDSNGSYIQSQGDFLFSLDKKLKYPLKNHNNYIYGNSSYGPTFGSGHDFNIADQCMNNENSYSKTPCTYDVKDVLTGSYNFKVAEIEVYKITTVKVKPEEEKKEEEKKAE